MINTFRRKIYLKHFAKAYAKMFIDTTIKVYEIQHDATGTELDIFFEKHAIYGFYKIQIETACKDIAQKPLFSKSKREYNFKKFKKLAIKQLKHLVKNR